MQPDPKPRPSNAAHFWTNLSLDRAGEHSLQHQLYELIRDGIILGLLPAGARIPASRMLAGELACSRNTVLAVFNQLIAEDYLSGIRGSGVFVSDCLPDETFAAAPHREAPSVEGDVSSGVRELSSRGKALASVRFATGAPRHIAFSCSMPDASLFPIDIWTQLHVQAWRDHGLSLITETDPRGYLPLREAIAEYVFASRNVACSPDQIIVTSGASQGVDLVGRLLLDAGDRAWVEDPGYPVINALLSAAGADVVPLPIDERGIDFADEMARPPRLISVSPTHQYPTGVMMSQERRFELLAYAARVGAWIVEDDYDGEFRYFGRPLTALAGFGGEASARVIYVGTFSKMTFPAIRLGYLVIPPELVHDFMRARAVIDLQPSILTQPALARFLAEGHLASHLRRMRPIYRERQHTLVRSLNAYASDLLVANQESAGMHITAHFTPELAARTTDVAISRRLKEQNINAQPLSILYAREKAQAGLVLGFACADEETLVASTRVLVETLRA